MMVSAKVVVCEVTPIPEAVTEIVVSGDDAASDEESVSVDAFVLPVRIPGAKLAVTPAGNPLIDSATSPV